jgi:glycine dehydrogenase subunit 1
MSRYTSATESDRQEMLAAIGVESIDDLFADVPEGVRLGRPLDLPPGKPEQEVYARLRDLAARNTSAVDEISFLGAGMYDHYVPALVDSIISRSEFLTPYTPYQPEISQGGLQVMFEYQTAISELTGLPVSNASLYDGPSAVGSGAYLAKLANGRPEVVVSRGVHPHSRQTLRTLAPGFGQRIVEAPLRDGVTDPAGLAAAVGPDTAAVVLQQPNHLGAVEDLEPLVTAAKEAGALVVCACDPLPLAILRPPGELGVDVAVGEGQSLGNRLDYGGPSFGFFAASEQHIRRMPGRIAGETRDADGRRGFVLTLQTREQHIRREKATHNICTAQVLNALAGVVYLSWLGKRGAVELAELMLRRTDYARSALAAVPGVRTLHDQPVVREFAVALDAPVEAVIERCAAEGVNPGHPLGRDYPEHPDGLLVAITERRTRADIDRLADVLGRAVAAERRATVGAGATA